MIELRNINLDNVSIYEQQRKIKEEYIEYVDALDDYEEEPNKENKQHVIEEFLDYFQATLGMLQKIGISADEVMEYYPKHLEKLKNRPRKMEK